MSENDITANPLKPKILIAEDDITSAALLKRMLANHAREILHTTTGKATLEMCQAVGDIDVVLMDMRMPDVDGYEATRRIRSFNREIVIIAQTAYALYGDEARTLEAGCDAYLAKPVSRDTLVNVITQCLQKKNPEKQN